jgi:hypothetical protein
MQTMASAAMPFDILAPRTAISGDFIYFEF